MSKFEEKNERNESRSNITESLKTSCDGSSDKNDLSISTLGISTPE